MAFGAIMLGREISQNELTSAWLATLQGLDTAHPRPAKWWGLLVMPFGAFLSILWVAGINRYTEPNIDMRVLVPSFGASAVLLFSVPESKLSQPRNFLGERAAGLPGAGCAHRHRMWKAAVPLAAAALRDSHEQMWPESV